MEIRVETPRPHNRARDNRERAPPQRDEIGRCWSIWRRSGTARRRCGLPLRRADRRGREAFSAGADISGDLSAGADTARTINRALLKDTPFSKPIVAAVNGDCVGGGLELLLSTDIRAAVSEARFGLPEVRWSIYPFGGATVKLTHQNRLCACDGSVADRPPRRCGLRRRDRIGPMRSSREMG